MFGKIFVILTAIMLGLTLTIFIVESLHPWIGQKPDPSRRVLLKKYAAKSEQKSQLANPASTNCIEKGGTLKMMTRGDGGEYSLCEFEDNMACEEWALYRGECPEGGVKTTGYDNQAQMYCAWLGGVTQAVADASCALPDGSTCSVVTLYNGTCPSAASE